jgi:hypothetical protein
MSPKWALSLVDEERSWIEPPEGVVYRVEDKDRVLFLAKWVRGDKVDGKYLFQNPPIWNWRARKAA